MNKEELEALLEKSRDNTITHDEEKLLLEELNKGADELLAALTVESK